MSHVAAQEIGERQFYDGAGPQIKRLDLTIPQRALLSRINASLALDFCTAIRQEVGIELAEETNDSGEQVTQPGDYLRVTCALDGLPVAATISLTVGAEIIESAAKE